jgi:hypothetical protein
MTILRENFRPVGDVLPVVRRDFPLADKTLASPDNAVSLFDGEWMTLSGAYQLVRAANIAIAGSVPAAGVLCFPLWGENGRYDVQAMADRKPPLLWQGNWEFETRVFDAAAIVVAGAAISAIWQPLKVATVTIGTRNYVGLVGHGGVGVDTDRIIGYVTKLASNNGGWLRLRGGNLY